MTPFCVHDHAAHPSPNLLAQTAPPTAPGRQLVSDITYIPTAQGWLYLAVVIDLFSRAVLGWKLSESLQADLVTVTLSRCLQSRPLPHPRLKSRARIFNREWTRVDAFGFGFPPLIQRAGKPVLRRHTLRSFIERRTAMSVVCQVVCKLTP